MSNDLIENDDRMGFEWMCSNYSVKTQFTFYDKHISCTYGELFPIKHSRIR